jgi:DNA-binding winged helix-turn-helix (wHTH) protein
MRLRFGECVLDADARDLLRGGERVALTPKALQLLTLLMEKRPRPLSHAELKDALWPDTHVGYTSLAGVVAEVRKAIGDESGPGRLIRTVARYGYAFSGEVASDPAPPAVARAGAFVSDETEFRLTAGETLIGRGDECGVVLPSTQVSRVHARVRVDQKAVTLEDLGSKNGTWVNGERLRGPTPLADGDEVTFGTFRVRFRRGAAQPTRTANP